MKKEPCVNKPLVEQTSQLSAIMKLVNLSLTVIIVRFIYYHYYLQCLHLGRWRVRTILQLHSIQTPDAKNCKRPLSAGIQEGRCFRVHKSKPPGVCPDAVRGI